MEHTQEPVLAVSNPHEREPRERPLREVEGPARFVAEDPRRLRFSVRLAREIEQRQRDRLGGMDDLRRSPLA